MILVVGIYIVANFDNHRITDQQRKWRYVALAHDRASRHNRVMADPCASKDHRMLADENMISDKNVSALNAIR